MESLALISGATQSLSTLSVQQLVDCDLTNNGMEGGWMHKGFAHAAKQGLMTADQYLFNGKQGECVFDSDKVAVRTTGMV